MIDTRGKDVPIPPCINDPLAKPSSETISAKMKKTIKQECMEAQTRRKVDTIEIERG